MIPGSPQPLGNFPDLQRDGQLAILASQQRRIRHIRSVAARNIQLQPIKRRQRVGAGDAANASSNKVSLSNSASSTAIASSSSSSSVRNSPDGDECTDVTQLHMYYTLHTESALPAFYTSEKIKGSMNPMWKNLNLDLQLEGSNLNLTQESLTVRVWYTGSDPTTADVCIHWDIHLSGLIYLGSKMLGDHVYRHAPNSLIFGLRDGFYGASSCLDPITVRPPALSPQTLSRPPLTNVEGSVVRHSYTVRSLVRVQTVLRALKQTEGHVDQIRQSIACRLESTKDLQAKVAEREMALLRVNQLREDVQWRVLHQLQHLKTGLEELQLANQNKEQSLSEANSKLAVDSDELHERKKAYFDIRERLLKTGAQLIHRRKQLLAELSFIYPIQQIPNSDHTIVDVRLPQSEDLIGHNENMLAVSLGYTCHLVMMISGCLDVPLRYPMEHQGSRSVIYDYIIETLPDREREFPLFSKGKQKYQFQYGVYLLNKNIAQLRHYCGMSTRDLRFTLSNLQTLLCDRLGVSPNQNDAFSNQHKLVPPSFGGPQQHRQSQAPPPISHHASVQQLQATPTPSITQSTTGTVIPTESQNSKTKNLNSETATFAESSSRADAVANETHSIKLSAENSKIEISSNVTDELDGSDMLTAKASATEKAESENAVIRSSAEVAGETPVGNNSETFSDFSPALELLPAQSSSMDKCNDDGTAINGTLAAAHVENHLSASAAAMVISPEPNKSIGTSNGKDTTDGISTSDTGTNTSNNNNRCSEKSTLAVDGVSTLDASGGGSTIVSTDYFSTNLSQLVSNGASTTVSTPRFDQYGPSTEEPSAPEPNTALVLNSGVLASDFTMGFDTPEVVSRLVPEQRQVESMRDLKSGAGDETMEDTESAADIERRRRTATEATTLKVGGTMGGASEGEELRTEKAGSRSSPTTLASVLIQRSLADIYRVSSSGSLLLEDENSALGVVSDLPTTNQNEFL